MPKTHDNLPTGEIKRSRCSVNDFSEARTVNDGWTKTLDYTFIRSLSDETGMFKLAKLWSETTGRKIIICSTQPCLQAYTGQHIPKIKGKSGTHYGPNHGIALEPQGFVDSLNHDNFPDTILRPGEIYHHKINYTFRSEEARA